MSAASRSTLAALVALLALGLAAEARAASVPFKGTLTLQMTTLRPFEIPASGIASVSPTGISHLATLGVPASAFGPVSLILPVTSAGEVDSIRFTGVNLTGTFSGFTSTPPAGGTMGISGMMRICVVFDATCMYVAVPVPLTPTPGGAGFGIDGTVHETGPVSITLQHGPWTVAQPAMTLHDFFTAVTTPALPAGFVHGPASGTSSTAQTGGVLQMVTATKVYTSLTAAFPEMPVTGVLRIELEQSASLPCDDGLDNDSDGLIDGADPGCDGPVDPFEENCGPVLQVTDNATEDTAPDISGSKIVWQQWDGADFEVVRQVGSSVTPLSANTVLDLAPAIQGPDVAWQQWGGGDAQILVDQGAAPIPLTGAGVSGWDPDVDNSGVVWSQGPSLFLPSDAVFYWDGSTTSQVFGSVGGEAPALEDGTVAWETALGIHFWNGATTVVIPGSAGGHEPEIWGSRVVWHASDGNDDEIFLWNGSTLQQLTDNATNDRNADLSGSRIVWEGAAGISFWKNGTTTLIAGSAGGQLPRIDDLDIVWQASDGSDNEIYLVTLCAACNDGVDNEGDGKIDYDGGLSALGYIAADPDPQCNDNPWKDKEKGGSCGLGFELAFLIPGLMWLRRRRQAAWQSASTCGEEEDSR